MNAGARHAYDALDKMILRILQENCSMGQREIGREVGLSATAVHRRIKRLKERGIIQADVAILDPSAFPESQMYIARIRLSVGATEAVAGFAARLSSNPSVQQCYLLEGDFHLMLVLIGPDDLDLRHIISSDPTLSAEVESIEVSRCLRPIKRGLALHLA